MKRAKHNNKEPGGLEIGRWAPGRTLRHAKRRSGRRRSKLERAAIMIARELAALATAKRQHWI